MLDYGWHSYIALKRGWNVTGYDVDCETANTISKKFKFEYLCGPFDKINWYDKKFDLVYTNQVVEHLKDPVKELGIIHNIIKEDGVFLVVAKKV